MASCKSLSVTNSPWIRNPTLPDELVGVIMPCKSDLPSPLDETDKRLSVAGVKATDFNNIPHLVSPEAVSCGHHEFILFPNLDFPLKRNKNNLNFPFVINNGLLLDEVISLTRLRRDQGTRSTNHQ